MVRISSLFTAVILVTCAILLLTTWASLFSHCDPSSHQFSAASKREEAVTTLQEIECDCSENLRCVEQDAKLQMENITTATTAEEERILTTNSVCESDLSEDSPDISVVIVVKNKAEINSVPVTEISVRRQKLSEANDIKKRNIESTAKVEVIIVVIAKSLEEECAKLCTRGSAVIYLSSSSGRAPTVIEGRQAGLTEAGGVWITFPNPGDYYAPIWAESILETPWVENGRAIFWNAAEGRRAYAWTPHPIASHLTSSLWSQYQGATLPDGAFAVRRLALNDNYPTETDQRRGEPHAEAFSVLRKAAAESFLGERPPPLADREKATFFFWSNSATLHRSHTPLSNSEDRPFLSVVVSTSASRLGDLTFFLHNFKLQTYGSFELIIVSSGDDSRVRSLIESIFGSDPRASYHFVPENKDWGHPSRERGLAIARGEWVLITNEDNYYVPTFIETMKAATIVAAGDGGKWMIHFSMVHNHIGKNYRWEPTEMEHTKIDMGSAIVARHVAQLVGFPFRGFDADWDYFHAIKNEIGARKILSIAQDRLLFVHN